MEQKSLDFQAQQVKNMREMREMGEEEGSCRFLMLDNAAVRDSDN